MLTTMRIIAMRMDHLGTPVSKCQYRKGIVIVGSPLMPQRCRSGNTSGYVELDTPNHYPGPRNPAKLQQQFAIYAGF